MRKRNLACDGSGVPHEGDLCGGLDPPEAVGVRGDVDDAVVGQGVAEGVELEVGRRGCCGGVVEDCRRMAEHLGEKVGQHGEREGSIGLEEVPGSMDTGSWALPCEILAGQG